MIILIILAAISISALTKGNFIGLATRTAENYSKAQEYEGQIMEDFVKRLEGVYRNIQSGGYFEKAGTIDGQEKGNSLNPTIPAGFKPVDDGASWGDGTKAPDKDEVNKGLVIEDKEGNQFVWVPCYVNGTNTVSEEVKKVAKEYTRHTYVNPSTDTTASTEHGHGWKTFSYTAYKDWKDEAYSSYGKTSVEKYGGFYVARYEAGIPKDADFYPDAENGYANSGANKKDQKDISGLKPVSKANNFSWNYVEQSVAKDLAQAMYGQGITLNGDTSGVKVSSYLIDGYAWDTIVEWMHEDVALNDSTNIGNYYNNTKTYTGKAIIHAHAAAGGWHMGSKVIDAVNFKLDNHPTATEDDKVTFTPQLDTGTTHTAYLEIPTGSVDTFKQKNIYDMAGNMWEWTTEVGDHEVSCSDSENPSIQNSCSKGTFAVIRGGGFDNSGNRNPLCYRSGNNDATNTSLGIGFRVVLYLS